MHIYVDVSTCSYTHILRWFLCSFYLEKSEYWTNFCDSHLPVAHNPSASSLMPQKARPGTVMCNLIHLMENKPLFNRE